MTQELDEHGMADVMKFFRENDFLIPDSDRTEAIMRLGRGDGWDSVKAFLSTQIRLCRLDEYIASNFPDGL